MADGNTVASFHHNFTVSKVGNSKKGICLHPMFWDLESVKGPWATTTSKSLPVWKEELCLQVPQQWEELHLYLTLLHHPLLKTASAVASAVTKNVLIFHKRRPLLVVVSPFLSLRLDELQSQEMIFLFHLPYLGRQGLVVKVPLWLFSEARGGQEGRPICRVPHQYSELEECIKA